MDYSFYYYKLMIVLGYYKENCNEVNYYVMII